jgi:hypothetical protein
MSSHRTRLLAGLRRTLQAPSPDSGDAAYFTFVPKGSSGESNSAVPRLWDFNHCPRRWPMTRSEPFPPLHGHRHRGHDALLGKQGGAFLHVRCTLLQWFLCHFVGLKCRIRIWGGWRCTRLIILFLETWDPGPLITHNHFYRSKRREHAEK